MSYLDDLPRGVPGRSSADQKLPDAAWLDPSLIARSPAYRFDGSKIFLGVVGGTVKDSGAEYYTSGGVPIGIGDDRHALLCAGSRSGKGRSCLVPTLLEYRGSALVLDPKGELAGITARRRSELGQRVCVLDPFDICDPRLTQHKAGFNPLAMLSADSPSLLVDAGLIADALVVSRSQVDPHWDESARNFIEGVILHVAAYTLYEGARDLVSVRNLISHALEPLAPEAEGGERAADGQEPVDSDALPWLHVEMLHHAETVREDNPDLAAALEAGAAEFFEKSDRERSSVLSVAMRNTKFLDYPQLRKCLSSHDFDLADLKTAQGGLSVYLCLPAGRMASCNRWFRLFVNLALEAMEREKARPEIPVLAVLEEFHVLGHMQQLEAAAALVAGFGMKLLIVLQDLSQLKRHYKEGWETFLGNCGVAVFFGNSDIGTLEFIAKRCGQSSITVTRGGQVTHERQVKGETGSQWSIEVRDLITLEEASRYFGRDDPQQRQLVIRTGNAPGIIQRVKYDLHEMFAGKFDD